MEFMQSEIIPSSQCHQMGGLAQCQMISPPLFQGEQHDYLEAPRGVLAVLGEELVYRGMDVGTAGCMVEPSNLKSEAEEVSDMYEYVDFDGYEV
jgi:hypothetical protein